MDVAPDPRDPKTIYIATHEAGVFKTSDSGLTWKQVNNGLGGMDVHGLAIDPNAASKLHAAVREKGAAFSISFLYPCSHKLCRPSWIHTFRLVSLD